MSSIISHIYMADKLKDRYKLKNEFLYGAILPDMLASTEVYNKKETHYLKKFEINGNIGDYPDIERYINENYKELSVNQIKQGYLTHLIEDQLWFSKYIPKLATKKGNDIILYSLDNSIHSEKEFSKHIYDDYPIMDRYLLKDRNINMETLKKEFLMLSTNNTITSNINKNFKLFDLQCNKFNLLTTDLINVYIEEALSKVILILDEFLYKK